MSQDQIERALTELASRADTHPTPDVVPAVHRRIRRNAAVRATVAAATVAAVVAGVSVLATGGLPFDRGGSPPAGRPTRTTPATGPQPTPTTPTPATGPYLIVDLFPADASDVTRKPPGIPAAVDVLVKADLPTGPGWDALRSILGLRIDWGDGSFDTEGVYGTGIPGPTATASCPSTGRRGKIDSSLVPMWHHYQRPGTYTVTYRTLACGLPGEVTKTIELTVETP